MNGIPPKWARDRAKEVILDAYRYPGFNPADYLIDLVAGYVVKTEEPPVDPDEQFVCDFLNSAQSSPEPRSWSLEKTKHLTPCTFANALAFYKASKQG